MAGGGVQMIQCSLLVNVKLINNLIALQRLQEKDSGSLWWNKSVGLSVLFLNFLCHVFSFRKSICKWLFSVINGFVPVILTSWSCSCVCLYLCRFYSDGGFVMWHQVSLVWKQPLLMCEDMKAFIAERHMIKAHRLDMSSPTGFTREVSVSATKRLKHRRQYAIV